MTEAEMKALSDAATQGVWAYRPNEYDDWGVVRGPVNGEYQLRSWIAQFKRAPYEGAELAEHRKNGTDPWGGNALFVTALVNAYRAGTIGDTAAAEAKGYERGLREAAARVEYASDMYHNSRQWFEEPAPDGAGRLWDWVLQTAKLENK